MRYFMQRSQETDDLERENERLYRERRQLLDQCEQEQRARERRTKPA